MAAIESQAETTTETKAPETETKEKAAENTGPTVADLEARFDLGRTKGKSEGEADALAARGIPVDMDPAEVRAALERGLKPPSQESPHGDEVAAQATEIARLTTQVEEQSRELEALRSRNEIYRLSEFKSAALAAGVIPEMVDDFVTVNGARVRWNSSNTGLETLSPDPSGKMIAKGTPLADMVKEILESKPAYRAPTGRQGAGGGFTPETPPERRGSIYEHGDSRTFAERVAGK